MRMHLAIRALGLLVVSAAASLAAPITYNFNWISEGNLPLPTSGSFTYNSAAAVGSQFSNFVIVWDSYTFNFTSVANSATVTTAGVTCPTTASVTSAIIFGFLTGTSECTPTPNTFSWIGNPGGPFPTFNLYDTSGSPGTSDIELSVASTTSVTGTPATVSGLFTTSTASVPEPSTFFLAFAGGAVLLGRRIAQAKRKSADRA